ncbi:unnamed protein product [Phytomonas sp. EM1]|nr:unnamed protein product [Phytomonas sp. EM1]|eukprot:CCW60530.1 unnamed protein product [Phytomonas sp. isolate EM1]
MAIFSCLRCGYMYEFVVSSNYVRKLITRTDYCPKCDQTKTFRFMSFGGMVGQMPFKPADVPRPSYATLYWRKKVNGKTANLPLDEVCPKDQF